MISTFTSPLFVNRVKESWQAGYGVTQTNSIDRGPFGQPGPTLDLIFTGVPTADSTFVGSSLNLDFLTQQYQLPAQYSIWDTATGGLVAKPFSQIVTFTRNSTATYTDSAGVLQTAAIDVPRFDYNPSTLASLGLLVEEARTNLALRSENFSDSSIWSIANATVTADSATAPNGAVTADLLTAVAAGTVIVTQPFAKAALSVIYSSSVWVKVAAGSISAFALTLDDGTTNNRGRAVFNLSTGATTTVVSEGTFTNTTATITPYINSWYRLSITTTSNTATSVRMRAFYTATGAGVENVYLWGAQLEADASFPTSYIGPTTTAAVTRAADEALINTLSPWYNSVEGTIFAQSIFGGTGTGAATRVLQLDDNTEANRIAVLTAATTNRLVVTVSSVPQSDLTLSASGVVKAAGAFSNSGEQLAANGTLSSAGTGVLVPTVDRMHLGSTASNVVRGAVYLQRITYYPRRMANYELQAITV